MRTRIDYLADKYSFTERNESPRLRRQWQDVLEECRLTEAGPEERLRIALLNVDYVTSFELPFRLLLTRYTTTDCRASGRMGPQPEKCGVQR